MSEQAMVEPFPSLRPQISRRLDRLEADVRELQKKLATILAKL